MKIKIISYLIALLSATSLLAQEPNRCGIDPSQVSAYKGYGVDGKIYDRGDYYFSSTTEFVSIKDSNIKSIKTHQRLYKESCETSSIAIIHRDNVAGPEKTLQIITKTDENGDVVKMQERTITKHNRQSRTMVRINLLWRQGNVTLRWNGKSVTIEQTK